MTISISARQSRLKMRAVAVPGLVLALVLMTVAPPTASGSCGDPSPFFNSISGRNFWNQGTTGNPPNGPIWQKLGSPAGSQSGACTAMCVGSGAMAIQTFNFFSSNTIAVIGASFFDASGGAFCDFTCPGGSCRINRSDGLPVELLGFDVE